jgi:TatD DNase family protein
MAVRFFDTHAHLDDDRFHADLDEVLPRAASAGVGSIATIAVTAASSVACVELAQRHESLYASVGIQPNHVADAAAGDWDQVMALSAKPKVVAVGETGLDRYWDHTPFAHQEDYFARHLALARRRNLAVVIHCRNAEADVVRMLREDVDRHGPLRAVMHSFTGDKATAEACLAMGLYISFAGMLTFKNAQTLRDVAAIVPLDRLVVETDSPYLSPVPLRGKRNEPAHVVHTAACLAGIKGVPKDTMASHCTRNAQLLFGLGG